MSSNSTPGGTSGGTSNSTTINAVGPDDIPYTVKYINDNAWPADFELDIDLGNWPLWSRRVSLLSDRQGFTGWLTGTLACPDKTTHAKAHHIWEVNNASLRAFILSHISQRDYDNVCTLDTAHTVFEELRKTHERQGLHAKLVLMKQAQDKRFQTDVPLSKTIDEFCAIHKRVIQMGPIDDDQLLASWLINGLNDNPVLEDIQSDIISSADDPNWSSKAIIRRLQQQDNLVRLRAEQAPTASSALAAQSQGKPRMLCAHCKKPGHLADFCIQPSGKMAGRSIEDARTAQRAAAGKPPRSDGTSPKPTSTTPAAAKVATSETKTVPDSVIIGGVTYYPSVPAASSTACVAYTPCSAIETLSMTSGDSDFSFHAFLALCGPSSASVDWNKHTTSHSASQADASPVLSHVSRVLVARPMECPFILDSGASNHISPERSDFKTLRPIAPHPIQGFNGSSTSAIGIGDIDLCIASGHKLMLRDVLYVPTCSTRLVSVSALTRNGYNLATFGADDCWVSDKFNKVIVRGTLSKSNGLYTLNCSSARVTHAKPTPSAITTSALYTKRIPDLETWHRRLGHCNTRTIIDMARDKVVKDMPIDLSSAPPKSCDSCILGKHPRSPVPKVREGVRAKSPLERVYVDLFGPMPCTSRAGRVYSMNVVDDHSGYVWSLPLKLKSEAASIFRCWHRAVENQSGHKLKILVTDNSEVVSKSMTDWCTEHGIEHQLTAPYTSAHNGRAERLHRTTLGRSRSMRLTCNAPAFFFFFFFFDSINVRLGVQNPM
jgi:hypothetical protein